MVEFDPAHVVGTGGALGALLRHAVAQRLDAGAFPVATLTVNVLGSFALAAFVFAGVGGDLLLLLGTGACGSFTTFSSFSFETVRLWETGARRRAAANALGNLLGAGLAIGLAWVLVRVAFGVGG